LLPSDCQALTQLALSRTARPATSGEALTVRRVVAEAFERPLGLTPEGQWFISANQIAALTFLRHNDA